MCECGSTADHFKKFNHSWWENCSLCAINIDLKLMHSSPGSPSTSTSQRFIHDSISFLLESPTSQDQQSHNPSLQFNTQAGSSFWFCIVPLFIYIYIFFLVIQPENSDSNLFIWMLLDWFRQQKNKSCLKKINKSLHKITVFLLSLHYWLHILHFNAASCRICLENWFIYSIYSHLYFRKTRFWNISITQFHSLLSFYSCDTQFDFYLLKITRCW